MLLLLLSSPVLFPFLLYSFVYILFVQVASLMSVRFSGSLSSAIVCYILLIVIAQKINFDWLIDISSGLRNSHVRKPKAVRHAKHICPWWDSTLYSSTVVRQVTSPPANWIIIIIIITTTMFMVLSSWYSHCESSPGSFDECRPERRVATNPQTKPIWAMSPPKDWLLPSADTIEIYYYYSARKLVLILPSHGGWKAELT